MKLMAVTWFVYKSMAFLVDRDEPRETLSTVSMNFTYNFLVIKYSGSIVQSHLLTSLAYAEDLRGMFLMGNNALLFPVSIFLRLPSTTLPSAS